MQKMNAPKIRKFKEVCKLFVYALKTMANSHFRNSQNCYTLSKYEKKIAVANLHFMIPSSELSWFDF